MILYAAILAVSYLVGFLIVRRLILGDQRDLVDKLRKESIDPKVAEEIVGEATRLVYTLGPAFLFGSILGATSCAIAWALGWGARFG